MGNKNRTSLRSRRSKGDVRRSLLPTFELERPITPQAIEKPVTSTLEVIRKKRGRPKKLHRSPDQIDRDAEKLQASLLSRVSNPKRPRRNVSEQKMREAITLLHQDPSKSVRQVALQFGIPRSTLGDRMLQTHSLILGRPNSLPMELERNLAKA